MTAPDRPPPPVTVRVPGRGDAPVELLAVGPPVERRPRRRVGPLPVGLAALAVLAAGVGVAARDDRPEPAPPEPDGQVSAYARVLEQREGAVLLELAVVVEGAARPSGDGPEPLLLRDVTVPGFQVRLRGSSLPTQVADLSVLGQGLRLTLPLSADVVVTDCALEVGAQRRLVLSLQRGDGPPTSLPLPSDATVVRALDRLVGRTCRRPRG